MPKRYIDADEFEKRVIQYPRQSTKTIGLALADTPTADVVDKEQYDRLLENATILAEALNKYWAAERKKGKWIKVGDNSYRCSVCDEISCCMGNYCPDCGADMREESDNE